MEDTMELLEAAEQSTFPVIKKLSEYMSYVERLPDTFNLSRGQTEDFLLLPGALRKDEKGNRKYSRQSVSHFINQFKLNSHFYMDTPWDIKNDYEWMIHAQHYGIPTRLLDFSRSHIVALMFAVERAFEEDPKNPKDGVVWFLNPTALNSLHSTRTDIFVLSELHSKLDDCNGPVVVQGRKSNTRVNAQNGVFLYFQDSDRDLVEIINKNVLGTNSFENIMKKIVIDGKSKKDILVALFSMGFGFAQIYPELSSVSKDILLLEKINEYKRYQAGMEDEE
ncbi:MULTISPECIES: FRG domain-containing protein [Bacillus]|uniref:FRG domain-containing protein n=1 Tax=Bacillus TaxID=1386 RepID=UPI0005302E47|nr:MULTISPECIES: FRG domain-containing protein [Bacillus subtilis group]AIX09664.1 FRG domain protein [Bacillus subtilis]MCY8153968.1 FRG domain-containing protein [Bacillus spizizenii]MCY9354947.1 FRG domain-containing protein [Bacillus spizizenii]MEC1527243.1 FRG domain-containing protein [Bacillus spizizenii]